MTEQTSLLASDHGLVLASEADALDALSLGLPGLVFAESDLHPDFDRFQTGLAGAVLQKFVNYQFRVGLVVSPAHAHGPRLDELMRDHERHPYVRFFSTVEQALEWLQ